MSALPFSQVDVFSPEPFRGNPVAVVHDADGMDEATMAAFARWTNLSETTFLLRPRDPAADYRLRIFTPAAELPFAGHPTLGSARAWLAAGGVPADPGQLVQECAAGLVRVRPGSGSDLAFAAPPLIRSGEPDPTLADAVVAALGVDPGQVIELSWVANGPLWLGVLLDSAGAVLDLRPDLPALAALATAPGAGAGLEVGVVGRYADGDVADVEVRAFCPGLGVGEDPVTGSLNAGLARWLVGAGHLPSSYTASQGTVLGRAGRVRVQGDEAGDLWVGGATLVVVRGTVEAADPAPDGEVGGPD